MPKSRRGNKEAKKPKQVRTAAVPLSPPAVDATRPAALPDRLKKK